MTDRSVEIMAPAGSFESLSAAVQAGADSVYFGIEQLNMRSRSANNFTLADLEKIADICHQKQIKSYVALNTVLYDHDIKMMKKIIDAVKQHQLSAVIVSDQAAIHYASERDVPVHLSTQLNISNTETLKFYAPFADVMVLARELNLKQVQNITSQVHKQQITGPSGKPVRIEVFVHGALCMAISGKCYLSLHTANASANRGACRQNCRRPYKVEDNEGNELLIDNEYIMSPKDLCTIDFLDKIIGSGVQVLKIEGRGRAPEYVYETVSCYKEAAKAYAEDNYTPDKIAAWKERLASVYNRGFWGGYYLGRKLGEWTDSDGSKAKKRKIYLGKGTNYFKNIRVAEFLLESGELNAGDEILITGPTTGVIRSNVLELQLDKKKTEKVVKGHRFTLPLEKTIRRSDKLYKIIPEKT